jgi:hypothetical protein
LIDIAIGAAIRNRVAKTQSFLPQFHLNAHNLKEEAVYTNTYIAIL